MYRQFSCQYSNTRSGQSDVKQNDNVSSSLIRTHKFHAIQMWHYTGLCTGSGTNCLLILQGRRHMAFRNELIRTGIQPSAGYEGDEHKRKFWQTLLEPNLHLCLYTLHSPSDVNGWIVHFLYQFIRHNKPYNTLPSKLDWDNAEKSQQMRAEACYGTKLRAQVAIPCLSLTFSEPHTANERLQKQKKNTHTHNLHVLSPRLIYY